MKQWKQSHPTVFAYLSVVLLMALTACQSTPPSSQKTPDIADGVFKRITIRDLGELIGKKIKLDNNYFVLDSNQTFTGSWSGKTMKGVWSFRDNYWCRTITEFFQTDRLGQEDCQLWEIDGNKLRGTRNKGSGNSFVYTVE